MAVCFDGSNIMIKNDTVFVVSIAPSGATNGAPIRSSSSGDPSGLVIAHTDPSDYDLPPGFSVKVPVGSGSASFTFEGSPRNTEYARLRYLSSLIPGNAYADYNAVNDFANSIGSASDTYSQCVVHANLFKQAACDAAWSWEVSQALGALSAAIGVQLVKHAGLLGALINLASTAGWANTAVDQLGMLLNAPKTVTIAAVASTPPCLTAATATQLFLTANVYGLQGTEQIEQISCTGAWAEGTIVNRANGVGEVAYRYLNGAWAYAASSGLNSEFCSQMAQLGAPASMLTDCPAGSTSPTTSTTAATAPCDQSALLGLVNARMAPGDSNTFDSLDCVQTWALAKGTSTFPPGGSPPEDFFVLYTYTYGEWSILVGPGEGTCIAAEAGSAPCGVGVQGPLISIPEPVLQQLVQQAGLTLAPDGTIS